MRFDDQSDESMPCVDCGKEIGLDCECVGPCHQCSKPVAMYACGLRFCDRHAKALMKANTRTRARIVTSLGWKPPHERATPSGGKGRE